MDPTVLQKQLRDNNADLVDFCKDMESWSEDMKRKESQLKAEVDSQLPLPRNIKRKSEDKCKQKKKAASGVEEATSKSRAPKDFRFWENFDADAECEKIDAADTDDLSDASDTEEAIEEANELKDRGNEFVKKGQWAAAKDCYTSAIGRYGYDSTYYCNRALCSLNLNEFKSAETDCSTALQLDKKYVKAMFRRAKARMALQQQEEAAEDLKTLLVIEPENKEAQKMLDSLVKKPKEVTHVSKFTASRPKMKKTMDMNTGTSNEPAFTGKVIERKSESCMDIPWPAGADIIPVKSFIKSPKDRSLIALKRIPVTDRCFTSSP